MKTKKKNNGGTTIVELMVYMIVGLIVITAAFQTIGRATRGHQHGRIVSRVQGDARTGVTVIARDMASMGFKTHFINNADGTQSVRASDVGYTDMQELVVTGIPATDPAVQANRHNILGNEAAFFFRPNSGGLGDTIEFFRIRVNNEGALEANERIVYFLDSLSAQIVRILYTWPIIINADNNEPVYQPQSTGGGWVRVSETVVVSNAVALKFRFGRRGIFDAESPAFIPASDTWVSCRNPFSSATVRRDQIRHIEVSVLVRSAEDASRTAAHGLGRHIVGDFEYTVPESDIFRIHRLYRLSTEVPSNARPPRKN